MLNTSGGTATFDAKRPRGGKAADGERADRASALADVEINRRAPDAERSKDGVTEVLIRIDANVLDGAAISSY
jgi:hypothetical protein